MATDVTEDPQAGIEEPTEETAPSRLAILKNKKVKVIGLLLLVMAVEAAGFLLLVPQPDKPDAADESAGDSNAKTIEVEFLDFRGGNTSGAAGIRWDITFTLVAEVPDNQAVDFGLIAKKEKKALIGTVVRGRSEFRRNAGSSAPGDQSENQTRRQQGDSKKLHLADPDRELEPPATIGTSSRRWFAATLSDSGGMFDRHQ